MKTCDYCGDQCKLVTGEVIYPHRPDLYNLNFWLCKPCDAYVGCHKPNKRMGYDGTEPLGRVANSELRKAKSAAHGAFDPLWRDGYFKSRKRAYNWLADKLKIKVNGCHIGMFDVDLCEKVVKVCKEFRGD